MRKIIYISNMRLPSELAHSFQIMKMCEAFGMNGLDVTLVVPRRFNKIEGDPFEYYDIRKSFNIVYLPCLDLLPIWPSRIVFFILNFSFYISAFVYCIFRKADFIYSRDVLAGLFFKDFIYEIHALPQKANIFLKRAGKFIVLTSFIKERLVYSGVLTSKILVSPDAVDLTDFSETIRSNTEKKVIGYVGSLKTMTEEKGIVTAISALKYLDENYYLCLVGGTEGDIAFYKGLVEKEELTSRVTFFGQVRHSLVPKYLSTFDFLIAPFPESEHYSYFMSPLKIFEYMAAKKPIIASDLPSIREILNENNSILIKPSDSRALAQAVQRLTEDRVLVDKISMQAGEDIKAYTWNKRAEKILEFIL